MEIWIVAFLIYTIPLAIIWYKLYKKDKLNGKLQIVMVILLIAAPFVIYWLLDKVAFLFLIIGYAIPQILFS